MTEPMVQCAECGYSLDVDGVMHSTVKVCPGCGSERQARLVGRFARAQELINEYLAVKPYLTGRQRPQMEPKDMTARQQVGLFLRTFGTSYALERFEALPRSARRQYNKIWPGFERLLREVCEDRGGNDV